MFLKGMPIDRRKVLARGATIVIGLDITTSRVESMDGHITPTKVAPPLITLKSVFEQVGATHEMSKKQVEGFLADFVTAMTTHLQSGARIRMSGLGTLEVRQSAARTGRNPATGEPIQIKASKKVAFRPAKELKEAV
jgi:DNA-binding protein HU-beta